MTVENLNSAIDYAIQSNYEIFDRQEKIWNRLKEADHICLFGIGKYYRDLKEKGFLKDYFRETGPIEYVSDNDRTYEKNPEQCFETNIEDACYIPPEKLAELENAVVLITVGNSLPIQKQLEALGGVECYPVGILFQNVYDEKYTAEWFIRQRADIIRTYDLFDDEKSKEIYEAVICNRIAPSLARYTFDQIKQEGDEYFMQELFHLTNEEYVADCGAYTGDSLEVFSKMTGGVFGGYYCFEINPLHLQKCKMTAKKVSSSPIEFYQNGVSDKIQEMDMEIPTIGDMTRITDVPCERKRTEKVKCVPLDAILRGKPVTLIKMDIEGGEAAALLGAKEIIRTCQPKLAISAYHYLSDLWTIPNLIHQLNPNYKLYLRHHLTAVWDTDCYAVPDK